VLQLEEDSTLLVGNTWIAKSGAGTKKITFMGAEPIGLEHRWDLFQKNEAVLLG
jgi:hypothetical protein